MHKQHAHKHQMYNTQVEQLLHQTSGLTLLYNKPWQMSLTHIGVNTMQQHNIILGALRPDKYLDLQHLLIHALLLVEIHHMP